MKKIKLAAAVSLLATVGYVQADTYFYGGASVGYARVNLPTNYIKQTGDDVINALGIQNDVTFNLSDDKSDTSYKFYGGYRYNENLAVEFGYVNLGKYSINADVSVVDGGNTYSGVISGESKSHGVFVDALGIIPATEQLDVFGRLGVAVVRTKASGSAYGCDGLNLAQCNFNNADETLSETARKTQLVPKLGFGVDYSINANVAVRAEYERYFNVGGKKSILFESDVDNWSVGLLYKF